jgi:hypothetical protein
MTRQSVAWNCNSARILTPEAGPPRTPPRRSSTRSSPAAVPRAHGSDGSPSGSLEASNNFSVSVDCDSIEEIERLFAAGELPLGCCCIEIF